MPFLVGEFCAYEGFYEILGQLDANYTLAQNQDVDVVVFHSLMRRIRVMTHPGPDSGQFVGCHAGSHAAAANQDAALGFVIQHRTAHGLGKVRIIGRCFIERADI